MIDAQRARPRMIWPGRRPNAGRVSLWVWLAVLGLGIAAALPVIRTATVTENGTELQLLEEERDRLRSEIRTLAAHVGQLGSLDRVEVEAIERLNMVPVRPTAVLEVDVSPPARRLPTRFLPAPIDAEAVSADAAASSSIWQRFAELLILE